MGNEAMDMNQTNQSSNQTSQSSKPNLPVDFQAIFERAKSIIINPKQALDRIENEKVSTNDLIYKYILPLSTAAFLCQWLGLYFIGVMTFFGGLIQALAQSAASVAVVYALALGIEKFLPKFQAQASVNDAVKLMAFASTPGMIGGLFGLVPALSLLGLFMAIYSLYLLYLGIPKLLNVSGDKHLPVFGAVILGGALCGLVIYGALHFLIHNVLGIAVYKWDLRALGVDLQMLEENMRQLQKYSPNP